MQQGKNTSGANGTRLDGAKCRCTILKLVDVFPRSCEMARRDYRCYSCSKEYMFITSERSKA